MSLARALSGEPLLLDLADEEAAARSQARKSHSGRHARTLIKEGPMRVTLIALDAGAEIPEHNADGPITVQVLSGTISFSTGGTVQNVAAGSVLALAGGVRHAVAAEEPAAFLLTVALPERSA